MFKCNPIAVILVSSGSRGDRLLFRYPYEFDGSKQVTQLDVPHNPYALREDKDECNGNGPAGDSLSQLAGYSDEILTTVLATKSELCGHKFELKVDNIRFVGHPTLVQDVNAKFSTRGNEAATMILFNVVFVLQGDVFPSVVHCYHDLSKRLALALRHEERRCCYLSNQAKIMLSVHDEAAALPEDMAESPYRMMMSKSKLCRDLKDIYENLCNSGVVTVQVNNWVQVSFCLPHKVHNVEKMHIQADVIEKSLKAIRPYHAVLLLEEENILESLPPDSSPSLIRIIKMTTPLKSLQQLSQDCDLALSQVFQIAGHLVYWGKATIIYPLCETNVYVLSPNCDLRSTSDLVEEFTSKFPGQSLTAVLSDFSLPLPLREHHNPLGGEQQMEQVHIVVWLLQNRLLVQLHTYVFLMPLEKYAQPDGELPEGGVSRQRMISERSTGSSGSGLTEPPFYTDDLAGSPGLDSYSGKSMELGSDGQSLSEAGTLKQQMQDTNLLADLSEAERLSVLSVPAARNDEDLRLFERLCPYFRGKHHLEEIMYYENLRRSDLLMLLDKFRDVLITCTHQDAATITYKEFL